MKCSFCGREIPKGTGKIIATREGNIYYICTSKCEKNLFKLRRKPQRIKWTARYQYEKRAKVETKRKEVKKKVKKKKTTRQERRKARLEKKKARKKKKEEIKKKKASGEKKK